MTTEYKKPLTKKTADSHTQKTQELFAALEKEYGYPKGFVDASWVQESHRGTDWRSPAGAKGHFQFMPATRREMIRNHGLDPWSRDITVAARCFAIHYHEQTERFGGDMEKGMAAYVAGGGNVRKAIRKYGDEWLSGLSRQARHYGREIKQRMGLDADIALNTHVIKAQYEQQQWATEHPVVAAEVTKPPVEIPLAEQASVFFSKLVSVFDFSAIFQDQAPQPIATLAPLAPKSTLTPAIDFNRLLQRHQPAPPAQNADHNHIEVPQFPKKQKEQQPDGLPRT